MKYNTHDWKGFLINDLISDLNYKSYLAGKMIDKKPNKIKL